MHEGRAYPEVRASREHELDGLLERPPVLAHEEGSDNSACSVEPVNRMHEDAVSLLNGIVDEVEGLSGDFIGDVEDGLHGSVHTCYS